MCAVSERVKWGSTVGLTSPFKETQPRAGVKAGGPNFIRKSLFFPKKTKLDLCARSSYIKC